MRYDHMGDRFRQKADLRQRINNRALLNIVEPPLPVAPLVATAGFNENIESVPAQQQAIGLEQDSIEIIRRCELGPDRPRHDAKHPAPIEPQGASAKEVPEPYGSAHRS